MADETTRILVVLDDSKGTEKALQYAADLLSGLGDVRLLLLHVLPRYPRAFEGFADVEHPDNDRWITPALERARKDWVRSATNKAAPLLERAKAILVEGGIEERAIRAECQTRESDERAADAVITRAIEERCRTIVVGRHVYPWLLDLVHRHLERDLVKRARNHAVWVVA